jgi:mannosylglycerate synthase
MITWMITRTGFSMVWPNSPLPDIEQPLGGELLFTRPVVEHLVAADAVQAQSDWGIDTLYTFESVRAGFSMYETYVPQGKMHALYGSLTDLRTMLIECFSALQSVQGIEVPASIRHEVESTSEVGEAVKSKVGYDVESSIGLLRVDWTPRQQELMTVLPPAVQEGLRAGRDYPRFAFMDDRTWYETYATLLDHFVKGDSDWEALLFRLWITRVLQYTISHALRGYDHALDHLYSMVDSYRTIAS